MARREYADRYTPYLGLYLNSTGETFEEFGQRKWVIMVNNTCLETERLLLKALDGSFASIVLDFFIRNKAFLQSWETYRDDAFYSSNFQRQQLTTELQNMCEDRLLKVWIFERTDKCFDKVIGSIALNEIIRGCFHSCFLGYRMDEHKRNQGYMTEAVRAVIDYAFNTLALHRIEANIMHHNIASLRVVKKLGFINEGLAKKYLKINGRWEDHIHMVLLNESME